MRHVLLLLALSTCSAPHDLGNGNSCSADSECKSGKCRHGECTNCATDADCGSGLVCSEGARVLGPPGGPFCVSADAGCASAPAQCPSGFSCTSCASGQSCNDSTGECFGVVVTPPPTCGAADFSNGYDAGTGPGPDLTNAACDSCIGCPLGSECLCGATGVIGGVRCSDVGTALACFITGGVGFCQVFPGDCRTNTQCGSTPATPFCSRTGGCVQCLRDLDCPQDAGAQGCVNGQCGACCTQDAQCPPEGPQCISGFCYACQKDGGCSAGDGGTPDAGASDGGTPDAGDGG